MKQQSQRFDLLGLVAGFAIWSSAFVVLYAVHGGACGASSAGDAPAAWLRSALIAIFALHLAAHAALIWWFTHRLDAHGAAPGRFLRATSLILAIAAMLATVWTSSPVLFLRLCG